MKRAALGLLLGFLVFLECASAVADPTDLHALLVNAIVSRPASALTGSAFAKSLSGLDDTARETAILAQLMEGNLPEFLKDLKPVRLTERLAGDKVTTATIFVMPDYLAVGSDRNFLRVPMRLSTATEFATHFGFTLPTKKMVDAIFAQADLHLAPDPLAAGPQMRSTAYYLEHNRRIEAQRLGAGGRLGALISGQKKDLVLTNRLASHPGRLAIYGWHRLSGIPIQPLSTVHGARYADYSHGIRLVSDTVLIDDEPMSIYAVLENPRLARLLSDEGPIPDAQRLIAIPHP